MLHTVRRDGPAFVLLFFLHVACQLVLFSTIFCFCFLPSCSSSSSFLTKSYLKIMHLYMLYAIELSKAGHRSECCVLGDSVRFGTESFWQEFVGSF